MRTTVSIPDELFAEGEALARRLKLSRSALYSRALRELIERSEDVQTTKAINRVLDQVAVEADLLLRRAARRLISKQGS